MNTEEKRVQFFKNKITARLEELRDYMPDLRYRLYKTMIDDCNSYDEIREMAELDLQFNMIKYVNELKDKLKVNNTNLEELEAITSNNTKSPKLAVIAPKPKSELTNEQKINDIDLSTLGEDMEDEDVLASAANIFLARLQNEPIEETLRDEVYNYDDEDTDSEIDNIDDAGLYGDSEEEDDLYDDTEDSDDDDIEFADGALEELENELEVHKADIRDEVDESEIDDNIIDFGDDSPESNKEATEKADTNTAETESNSDNIDNLTEDELEDSLFVDDDDSIDIDEYDYDDDSDESDIDNIDSLGDDLFDDSIDDYDDEDTDDESGDESGDDEFANIDGDDLFDDSIDDEDDDSEDDDSDIDELDEVDDIDGDDLFEDSDDELDDEDDSEEYDSDGIDDLDDDGLFDDSIDDSDELFDDDDSSDDDDSNDIDIVGDDDDDEFDIDESDLEAEEPDNDLDDFFNDLNNETESKQNNSKEHVKREITPKKVFLNNTKRGKQTQNMFNLLNSIIGGTGKLTSKAYKNTKKAVNNGRNKVNSSRYFSLD